MVCFIQYINKTGHANVDFLDIANVLEFGTSADAATLFKTIKHLLSKNGLDIANCSSFVPMEQVLWLGRKMASLQR